MGKKIQAANLFDHIPADLSNEFMETIVETDHMRIERIVSRGHVSEAGFWYDQAEDEYVVLLQGRAHLRFDGEAGYVCMKPGDGLVIPRHRKHRVEWTDPEQDTIWLAVFYRSPDERSEYES